MTHAHEYLEGVIQSVLGTNTAALENAQTSVKLIMMAANAWVHYMDGIREVQARTGAKNIKPRFFQGSETDDRKRSGTQKDKEEAHAGPSEEEGPGF